MKARWQGFSSVLRVDIQDYLDCKRAVKKKFHTQEKSLRLFDRFLTDHSVKRADDIAPATIEQFLSSRPRHKSRSFNHLLSNIRCFFSWMVTQERLEQSPVKVRPQRTTEEQQPFLFDAIQAKRLLDLASALPDNSKAPDREPTYFLMFALMYALGLRVSEVCRLCRRDVDLSRNLLVIRQTKFSKDRLVPFGCSVSQSIHHFIDRTERRYGVLQPDDPVFSFCARRHVNPCTVSQTFHRLVTQHKFTIPAGVSNPRLHCLRHSFAVGTLLRWYKSGVDPNQRLIHLSTFLGHVDPVSTSWYLSITKELLEEASNRFERYATIAEVSR